MKTLCKVVQYWLAFTAPDQIAFDCYVLVRATYNPFYNVKGARDDCKIKDCRGFSLEKFLLLTKKTILFCKKKIFKAVYFCSNKKMFLVAHKGLI